MGGTTVNLGAALAGMPTSWRNRVQTTGWFVVLAALVWLLMRRDYDDPAPAMAVAGCAVLAYGAISRAPGLAMLLVAALVVIPGAMDARKANAEYDACRASDAIHCESGLVEIAIVFLLVLALAAAGLGILARRFVVRRSRPDDP